MSVQVQSLKDDVDALREHIEEIEPRGYGQAKKKRLLEALHRVSSALFEALRENA
jgi:hypothetical protein